jgi:SAM-dependent methyltransferase
MGALVLDPGIAFPPVRAGEAAPVWNASAFVWLGHATRVLAYDVGESGWSDDLTDLHEAATNHGAHFIDVASRLHAMGELRRVLGDRAASILEVGCSAGHMLADMRKQLPRATLIGADYTLGTLNALGARMPGIPLVRLNLATSPLPSEAYEAIVLLNVLEHIEDDAAAIRHVARMLKSSGIALIEVPAGPGLFDDYDRELRHFRRYGLDTLCRMVEEAGLSVEYKSHLGAFLYPGFCLTKKLSQVRPKPARKRRKHVTSAIVATSRLNALGSIIMAAERALGRKVRFGSGIRCIVTARKK